MSVNAKFHCPEDKTVKNDFTEVESFLFTDYSIDLHTHDFYEMNIVMRGEGTHKIENASFRVRTGDVFVIPPMTVHGYFDTRDLDVYHILFRKSFIEKNRAEASSVLGFIQLFEIEPFLRRRFPDAMFLHLLPGELMKLRSDLSVIERDSEFYGKEYGAIRRHTAWKLVYHLSHLLNKQLYGEGRKKGKHDGAILSCLEYIHRNYAEKITLDTLCMVSFLSRSTLIRAFQSICSCTPSQYLNQYRCGRALEIMRSTSMSKTEIAHECGFYDLSHIERMLKKI